MSFSKLFGLWKKEKALTEKEEHEYKQNADEFRIYESFYQENKFEKKEDADKSEAMRNFGLEMDHWLAIQSPHGINPQLNYEIAAFLLSVSEPSDEKSREDHNAFLREHRIDKAGCKQRALLHLRQAANDGSADAEKLLNQVLYKILNKFVITPKQKSLSKYKAPKLFTHETGLQFKQQLTELQAERLNDFLNDRILPAVAEFSRFSPLLNDKDFVKINNRICQVIREEKKVNEEDVKKIFLNLQEMMRLASALEGPKVVEQLQIVFDQFKISYDIFVSEANRFKKVLEEKDTVTERSVIISHASKLK